MEKRLIWLFVLILLVQLTGAWFIDVMDVDSAQYASMSVEMIKSRHFLQVYDFGKDYLDKPPLLFWLTSFSYWIFGISAFSFRFFPLIISFVIGGWACYRFCRLFYSRDTGIMAALFYLSSQTVFLMAFDLRTDSLLTSAVIFALTEFALYIEKRQWKYLLAGAIGLGLALLAKGPVALIVIVFALGAHLLLRLELKKIFDWRWLVALSLSLLLLAPMCYGLYEQFDLHPEKLVNGHKGVSGLRFFFWGQSFGRITGESTWKNDTDKFFLLHSYLWCALPWSGITLAALFYKFKKFRSSREYLTLGGFLFTITALSFSAYKLPHYINVLIPLGSILTAWFISEVAVQPNRKGLRKGLRIVQGILLGGLWIVVFLLAFTVFPLKFSDAYLLLLLPALAGTIWGWRYYKNNFRMQVVVSSALTIIGANFFMNAFFYPHLLPYQAPGQIGKFAKSTGIPSGHLFVYDQGPYESLDFYTESVIHVIKRSDLAAQKRPFWVYIDKLRIPELEGAGRIPTIVMEASDYPVTRLSLKFLNQATRPQVLKKVALVRVN